MPKTALILLAGGAEELETIAVVDILVRAKVALLANFYSNNIRLKWSLQVLAAPALSLVVVGLKFNPMSPFPMLPVPLMI